MSLRPLILAAAIFSTPLQAETLRCGWYNNPAPGTIYLKDADGFWWIALQNHPPAPGFEAANTPAFEKRRKKRTSASAFAFSCACVAGTFGPVGSMEVRSITRLEALDIARCEDDPRLSDSPFFGE